MAPKVNGRWIEPFLGTGVVVFNSEYKRALLNDANPHIIRFYKGIQDGEITPHAVRDYLEREGNLLRNADDNGYVHYLFVRERFNQTFSPFDFLFLSRAGFNGMMRFGSKGNWNIPFCKKPERFSPAYITKIVNQVAAVSRLIKPDPSWTFVGGSFEDVIRQADHNDIIYCDPPYFGRHVDYYNGWSESDERQLFDLLSDASAKFILSTWHHNDWRENEMIDKYWKSFNIVTRDHFYHAGANIENRRTIVEALVCNFEPEGIDLHNHGKLVVPEIEQLALKFTSA
ncbi:MAG: DNA adenine methylase [Pyrinomonadaceae bacterium]